MSIAFVIALAVAVFFLTADAPPRRVTAVAPPAPFPVAEALASDDEAEVLAAIDGAAARGDKLPALVLYHPSQVVVRRALDRAPYLHQHAAARVR